MNLDEVKRQAQEELNQELFRDAVDKMKLKIKTKRTLWDVLFPWRIVFIRKEKQ